jgi:hypothetical protein
LVDAGYSSKNFKTFLFTVNIKLVDSEIPISQIRKDFDKHIRDTWTQQDIEESISEYDDNILVYLNEYLYAKNKCLPFDFAESVNVEHIMPGSGKNIEIIRRDAGIPDKEEFQGLVNKLGNKILLEDDINKSIGNEWFRTKKHNSIQSKSGYVHSRYAIAKELTRYPKDTWEKIDINKATEKVAERIVNFIFNEH